MDDLLVAREGDKSVVLHVPSGTYLRLDAAATEILTLLQTDGPSGAAATLTQRHGLDPALATEYVTSVLEQLREARAVGQTSMRRPGVRGGASVVQQWARLPGRAKAAVMETTVLVVAIELALRMFPIDTIARRVGAPLADSQGAADPGVAELDMSQLSDRTQQRLAAADWTLARWVFDATCLRKALLYGWVLRGHGPELHIGLMKTGDALAHAWLAVDGGTLGASGDVEDFGRLGP
jgi:hypothetical protein